MLSHLYPEDKDFHNHAKTATKTLLTIAKGLGAPDNPDFNTLGFDFETGGPGGRNEPMTRWGMRHSSHGCFYLGTIFIKIQRCFPVRVPRSSGTKSILAAMNEPMSWRLMSVYV